MSPGLMGLYPENEVPGILNRDNLEHLRSAVTETLGRLPTHAVTQLIPVRLSRFSGGYMASEYTTEFSGLHAVRLWTGSMKSLVTGRESEYWHLRSANQCHESGEDLDTDYDLLTGAVRIKEHGINVPDGVRANGFSATPDWYLRKTIVTLSRVGRE